MKEVGDITEITAATQILSVQSSPLKKIAKAMEGRKKKLDIRGCVPNLYPVLPPPPSAPIGDENSTVSKKLNVYQLNCT